MRTTKHNHYVITISMKRVWRGYPGALRDMAVALTLTGAGWMDLCHTFERHMVRWIFYTSHARAVAPVPYTVRRLTLWDEPGFSSRSRRPSLDPFLSILILF
jgi:hypothetical protein